MLDNMNSGCRNLIKNYTDMKQDVTITRNNLFGQEKEINIRIDDKKRYRIIDCYNCQAGVCGEESGKCECPEGVTGIECTKACLRHNGEICGGHGECGQNDLFTFFNPESELTQCVCEPIDEYTDETRDYYARLGIEIDPPPAKNYYGKSCEYHCPRYNQNICGDRGECTTIPAEGGTKCKVNPALSDLENPYSCQNNMRGSCLDGVFCHISTNPWNDYARDKYNVGSYFEAPSPGSRLCKKSTCQTELNDYDWSKYCVNMLEGLYPAELNSPQCAHNKDHDSLCAGLNGHIKCSQALEDAFSRAKTCSEFEISNNGDIKVYDAWDTSEMDISVVVLNV